jgi:4'-phosphopantetheinyl transferase EntD
VLDELVPPGVATAETFADPPGTPADHLHPEEWAVVASAVERRRNEFATVRLCARRALTSIGLPPATLLPGTRGAPRWPEGAVGSMTHCDGFRGAAVARSADMAAIGIDAEPDAPLPGDVLDVVALARERRWMAALAVAAPAVHWDRLLFSAKESVFKAWYPLAGRELDFQEAEITVDPDGGTFTAALLVPGPRLPGARAPLAGFTGRWLARDGLILTAVTVPHPGTGEPGTGRPGR